MEYAYKRFANLYLIIFILLSLSTFKIFDIIRVSQLVIVLVFLLFLFSDNKRRENDLYLLIFFFIGASFMTFMSLSSDYQKIGEIKFVIKYYLIYPATFYVGAKAVQKIGLKYLIKVLEIAIFMYVLCAYIIYFIPLPPSILDMLVHYREGFGGAQYLDFQGTFFETGGYALAVGSLFIASLLLRYEFGIWPKNRILLYGFYLLILISLILSRNKTIWIALMLIAFMLIIFSIYKNLLYTKWHQYDFNDEKIKKEPILKIKNLRVFIIAFIFICIFYFINNSLQTPIISSEMIEEKMTHERGKALSSIFHLLEQSSWMGGYGFGFIEHYYSAHWLDIMGLGKGAGMVFNSYLDIWLSVSYVGLFYHFVLLHISMSRKYYFTMIIPLFYFIFANTNPVVGDEYYYLFLGISYGLIQERNTAKN